MLTLFALILTKCLYLEGKLFGDHVCQREIIEPREILQYELKNRTVRTYKWCLNVPPRCSVYSNKVYNESNISVINIKKSIESCCDGFREQNSYCISMCQDCKNGLCLKGTCICQSGWDGPNCDSRALNSIEEISHTTKVESSSTIKFTTQTTITPIDKNYFTREYNTLSRQTSTSNSTDFEETTTSPYSLVSTSTQIYGTSRNVPVGKEGLLSFSNEETLEISSPKNSLKFSKELSFLDYDSTKGIDLKKSGDESVTDDNVHLDTTVTKQTIESSTASTKMIEAIDIERNSIDTNNNRLNPTTAASVRSSKFPDSITTSSLENPDLEVDYRELGGQSFEDKSVGPQDLSQSGVNKNSIYSNLPKRTSIKNEFEKYSETNIKETSTQHVQEQIASVLDTPSIFNDGKINNLSKEKFEDILDNFTEERYQKRSSDKNYNENTLLTINESDNSNLVYSVCAATATTVLILIVAIIVFTLRNARKKIDKNKNRKDVASVAVYTTSIFHSPLPDPPTFENPTYLSTGGNNSWNKSNDEEMIEVQDFNVIFQKPLRNPKLDCKQYLYDHPPSTGSYRASSEIDALSQCNLSHKSLSGIILEPVYDEIPSRDNPVDRNDENDCSNENFKVDASKTRLSYVDNSCLYVNTFGRTKF